MVGILGFLIATSVVTGAAERKESAPRKAQLVGLIGDRQTLVDDLDGAVETLRRDVLLAKDRASRVTSRGRREAAIQELLAEQAGTVALRGPGLVVSLAPSERRAPSAEDEGAYRINDADLQLVVNALWAAGAEAVAINDSRLVATTPIRAAGDTIVVNFRPLSPPYRVSAIGADRPVFERSDIARRFKRWITLFGLGFTVQTRNAVTVPGYTGRVGISAAAPEVTG